MKHLVFITSLFFSLITLAQTPMKKIIFYDSIGKETQSKEYSTKNIIKEFNLEKTSYEVESYVKTNDKEILVSKYTVNDKIKLTKNGEHISFYESGIKRELTTFNNGVKIGITKKWYENGSIWFEGRYDLLQGVHGLYYTNYWNKKGEHKLINGNGTYEYFFDKDEKIIISGPIKNQLKDGVWKSSNNDFPKYEQTYDNGNFVSGKIIKSDSIVREYTDFEVPANFAGSIDNFRRNVVIHMNNYKQDMEIDIVGNFKVTFIVNPDGILSDFKVLNSVGDKIDSEIIEFIKKYSKWNSAIMDGQEVKTHYIFPIKFR